MHLWPIHCWQPWRRFLLATAPPLNLALLRVVLFGMLWLLLEMRSGPGEPAWLLSVARISTLFALLGCCTPAAAWISSLIAMYLLGPITIVGDLGLTWHPVLLIGLLLGCCRSGDALSVDAIWQAIGRADHGKCTRLPRSVRYGMPLRLASLLLASGYFFPALAMIIAYGQGSGPVSWPWILFGLVFPVALLWRVTRGAGAIAGWLSHQTHLLSWPIAGSAWKAMYVLFLDWQRLLAALGRWMYASPLVVLYDGNCKLCRRTMALLSTIDWLEALRPINAFDRERFTRLGLGHLPDDALMTDLHAAGRGRQGQWHLARGFAAYQRIAWRVPLLWLLLPVIYLPPVVAVGRRVYRRVADSRACQVPVAAPPVETTSRGKPVRPWSPWGAMLVTLLLLLVQACLVLA